MNNHKIHRFWDKHLYRHYEILLSLGILCFILLFGLAMQLLVSRPTIPEKNSPEAEAVFDSIDVSLVPSQDQSSPADFEENKIIKKSRLSEIGKEIQAWSETISADTSFVVIDLETESTIQSAANEEITSASLFKVYVLVEALKKVDNGEFSLTQVLPSGNQLDYCLEQMIIISNDDCAWEVGWLIGWENINTELKKIGIRNTDINNYHPDGSFNGNKRTTANDVSQLLLLLHEEKLLSVESRNRYFTYLENQEVSEYLPEDIPKNILIAHKTGTLEDVNHEAGYIYIDGKRKYLFVVMTENWGDNTRQEAFVAFQDMFDGVLSVL